MGDAFCHYAFTPYLWIQISSASCSHISRVQVSAFSMKFHNTRNMEPDQSFMYVYVSLSFSGVFELLGKSDYQNLHFCPSACLTAGVSGGIFMKFGIGTLLRKFVKEPQVWLKSDKNIGHFVCRPDYFYSVFY